MITNTVIIIVQYEMITNIIIIIMNRKPFRFLIWQESCISIIDSPLQNHVQVRRIVIKILDYNSSIVQYNKENEKSLRKLNYDDDYKYEMIVMRISHHNEKPVPFSYVDHGINGITVTWSHIQ